jgi:predicted transcriptional regulator
MPVFSSNVGIPRPADHWASGDAVPVRIKLPIRAIPQLEWLSKRWAMAVPSIAADVLVAATSGRYLLAQLTGHQLQPEQSPRSLDSSVLILQLLKPSVDVLDRTVVPNMVDLDHKCGKLILDHLQGVFNPQLVSIALPDPDGEKLCNDDDSLKIHMPEELERRINTLAGYHELTKSDVIRNSLLLHVYGRIRYELWTADGNWRPKRKATKEELQGYLEGSILKSPERTFGEMTPRFSRKRRTEFIQEHGKSIEPTRVFMPSLLKQRLQELAEIQKLRISEFCRRTLVTLI